MVKVGVEAEAEAEAEAEVGMAAALLRSVGDTLMNGFFIIIA